MPEISFFLKASGLCNSESPHICYEIQNGDILKKESGMLKSNASPAVIIKVT
jgi:hypothetical protein